MISVREIALDKIRETQSKRPDLIQNNQYNYYHFILNASLARS